MEGSCFMDDSCCCKSIGSEIECRRRSSSLEIRTPRRFETLSPFERPGMKIPGTSSSRRRGKTTTFRGGSPGPSEIVFRSALSSDSSGDEPRRDMSGNPGRKKEEVCPEPDFLLLLPPPPTAPLPLVSLELLPTQGATTTTVVESPP